MDTVTEHLTIPGNNIPLLIRYEQGCTPRPAVIVLHGTRRSKEIGVEEHDRYLSGGDFIRVYPDAPLHGERAIKDQNTSFILHWKVIFRVRGMLYMKS